MGMGVEPPSWNEGPVAACEIAGCFLKCPISSNTYPRGPASWGQQQAQAQKSTQWCQEAHGATGKDAFPTTSTQTTMKRDFSVASNHQGS